jgi:SPP1 gp7 family putative phage head morphogenesis protein
MPLPDVKAVLVKHRANAKASSVVDDFEASYTQEVRDSVVAALNDGLTLSDWTDSFDAINTRYGFGEGTASYAETVFRTVGQSAMNGGKVSDMFSAEGQARAEYWQFSGIDDDRECDECAPLDGQIFAKTDVDAMGLIPPVHFSCRCSLLELDATDVGDQPVSAANATDANVDFDNDLLVVR